MLNKSHKIKNKAREINMGGYTKQTRQQMGNDRTVVLYGRKEKNGEGFAIGRFILVEMVMDDNFIKVVR